MKLINQFGSIESLLAETNQLKGALKKKIEENKEKIVFSKFLATIRTDVPIELNLDSLKVTEPDNVETNRILDELEFKSLKDKIIKKTENKQKTDNIQLDLFSVFTPDGQEKEKNARFEDHNTILHEYKLIDNENSMHEICDYFMTKEFISLDTETTSTNPLEAELVGLSLRTL